MNNSLESIQILSRSYAVRYRECCANETLVWQFKPIRKSINWAIWRKTDQKPGQASSSLLKSEPKRRSRQRGSIIELDQEERNVNLKEKLVSVGLEEVIPGGRCEGGQIQKGTYNVIKGGIQHVFCEYIEDCVLHFVKSPCFVARIVEGSVYGISSDYRFVSGHHVLWDTLQEGKKEVTRQEYRKTYLTIGYAKRYFTLSVVTGELSYSLSLHNPILRGTIPLALAALNIDYSRREFILDSGSDVWHLKASNENEFGIWKTRLEDVWLKAVAGRKKSLQDQQDGHEISTEWKQVEGLVDRLAMMKDFVCGIVQDIAHEGSKSTHSLSLKKSVDNIRDTKTKDGKGMKIFRKKEKSTPPASPQRELSVNSLLLNDNFLQDNLSPKLVSLDQNLESILISFQSILSNLRLTSAIPPIQRSPLQSRRDSIDSTPEDWFDAQSVTGLPVDEGLITVVEQETESDRRPDESSEDDDDIAELRAGAISPLLTMAPTRSLVTIKNLYPLGEWHGRTVKRRISLPAQITIPPPSLLAFLRKNVGKDFSTIAMPVTSNEPTTLLQRLPEDLEYSKLLDIAATTKDPHRKMLHLAIFAQSFLSTLRSTKRALRKSFTPLLAETYELVREDKGWRFLAEKVNHRPQVFAAHAESEKWTWSFCPSPRQKFWGKSFEMTIEGTIRVVLLGTREVFTWQKPACYMRNIIAGEKYIEPVGEIIVWNHTSGEKAVVEFKPPKGIWSGRAEDLGITTYTNDGEVGLRAEGKWTESINVVPNGEEVWRVGELVGQDDKFCGFPVFTAQLSEITVMEEGFLAPTDSRLRPDRKLHELGKMDDAEEIKIRLEEEQRVRRREGKEPPVKWFEKVTLETEGLSPHPNSSAGNGGIGSDSEEGGEEQIWRIKEGKDGYWSRREDGKWDDVIKLW